MITLPSRIAPAAASNVHHAHSLPLPKHLSVAAPAQQLAAPWHSCQRGRTYSHPPAHHQLTHRTAPPAPLPQGTFGALIVINSFPSERMLSLRERAAGSYHVSAYFLAKVTAETIAQLPSPIIFSIIVYFLVGFQPVAAKFFIFMAFMVLTSVAATSLATAISAIGRTTDMAVTILPMALEICRLLGGFYLSPANLPAYFSWLDALSYVKYRWGACAGEECERVHLCCVFPLAPAFVRPRRPHSGTCSATLTPSLPLFGHST